MDTKYQRFSLRWGTGTVPLFNVLKYRRNDLYLKAFFSPRVFLIQKDFDTSDQDLDFQDSTWNFYMI